MQFAIIISRISLIKFTTMTKQSSWSRYMTVFNEKRRSQIWYNKVIFWVVQTLMVQGTNYPWVLTILNRKENFELLDVWKNGKTFPYTSNKIVWITVILFNAWLIDFDGLMQRFVIFLVTWNAINKNKLQVHQHDKYLQISQYNCFLWQKP